MPVPVPRVQAHHPPRGRCGRPTQRGARPAALSRPLAAHLAWSGIILVVAAALIGAELRTSCPPGGPLAFESCDEVRPFLTGVVGLAAALYVIGLSAVRWWTVGLRRRGVADERATRDWYLLAAGIGLLVSPLLAFTLVSALR